MNRLTCNQMQFWNKEKKMLSPDLEPSGEESQLCLAKNRRQDTDVELYSNRGTAELKIKRQEMPGTGCNGGHFVVGL